MFTYITKTQFMKRPLIYFVPLLMVCLAGCLSKPAAVIPTPHPKGSFSGKFWRFHFTKATSKIDTLIANITLVLDSAGNYSVGGDTTSVHAGSFGKWGLGVGDDLVFTDKTLPATGTPTKQHLDGDYLYSYDGSTLQLLKGIGDTLSYQYSFSKTSN